MILMVLAKMSKSRGNVVLPEEVVYGVMETPPGYEFHLEDQSVIDPVQYGIWRDKDNSGMFFTATRHGRQPVFLHRVGDPVPVVLLVNGHEKAQHTNLTAYWLRLLELYENPDTQEAT